MKIPTTFILLISIYTVINAQVKELNIGAMVQPVPESYVFQDPSYFIWGGSVVEGKDGKYHMLYARWPKTLGFSAWVTDSEIAHAVADKVEGPYETSGTVLKRRNHLFWDGMATHNPTVIEKDGKYYLYYMGTTGPENIKRPTSTQHKSWWTYRNNQRIGVAVADNPQGPWERFNKPVLDVSNTPGAYDELMTSNPSVTYNNEGEFIMTYKAVDKNKEKPNGTRVRFLVAFAEHPTGPFVKEERPIFETPDSKELHMVAEDPYIWFHDRKYNAVVRDVVGKFTGDTGALALLESKDGKDWKPSKYAKVLGSKFKWANGELSGAKLERPQLFIKDGIPKFLFGATSLGINGARTASGNVRLQLLDPSKN
ncbi:glycoside hydrolase family protein [Maribacter ulvicola]|uniref:Glycosyl hydrolases family 43 n=1 Tax=Maribacter ulvicola TaxID=228959 RepID=A0A1N6X6J5_9FLAO|nr:glycoside hydrolase family protein [Maribacter ulvicola]SIQ97984.1 Glycosyl hydrolases family 43 [Maribacter ulvicola]